MFHITKLILVAFTKTLFFTILLFYPAYCYLTLKIDNSKSVIGLLIADFYCAFSELTIVYFVVWSLWKDDSDAQKQYISYYWFWNKNIFHFFNYEKMWHTNYMNPNETMTLKEIFGYTLSANLINGMLCCAYIAYIIINKSLIDIFVLCAIIIYSIKFIFLGCVGIYWICYFMYKKCCDQMIKVERNKRNERNEQNERNEPNSFVINC
jgi:hypothetical protein